MTLGALILENGSIFKGQIFGYQGASCAAEVVFNTGMVGYLEVMTDPSYKGQMVVMTYPLMGNYGINQEDNEAINPSISGFIVKEACAEPSNWRVQEKLDQFLKTHNITGLQGVDTRRLTRVLREKGTMKGMIVELKSACSELATIQQQILKDSDILKDPVSHVTTRENIIMTGSGKRIVVLDFGVKKSILKDLNNLGLELIVVPSDTSSSAIMELQPDGLFLTNGPGNPKDVSGAIEVVANLYKKLPVFGICLGHQVLALAMGGDTYKLKFGHRGINHPVKDLIQDRVHITSQNHGYAVRADSLPAEVSITHVNLNDNTVEGFTHLDLPVMSVQYHPESSPGPEDSRYIFNRFLAMLS